MQRQLSNRWVQFGVVTSLMLVSATLCGCGGGYGCGAGYAVNNPALEVTNVKDSLSGAAILRVTLSNFRFNGAVVTDLQTMVPSYSHGVVVAGDALVCDIPCTFGRDAGDYQFTAVADGYKPAGKGFTGRLILDASQCPTHTIGGAKVMFALDPK